MGEACLGVETETLQMDKVALAMVPLTRSFAALTVTCEQPSWRCTATRSFLITRSTPASNRLPVESLKVESIVDPALDDATDVTGIGGDCPYLTAAPRPAFPSKFPTFHPRQRHATSNPPISVDPY